MNMLRLRTTFFLCFLMVSLISCKRVPEKLTEQDMKKEIRQWWTAKIFQGVIIEDTVNVWKKYVVNARMVVCYDTLEWLAYEFKEFRKGWRVSKGPVDEKTKKEMIRKMLKIPLNRAKNNIIMSNMRDLQRALMQYANENDGRFPADLNVKRYRISYNLKELLGHYMKNPYIPGTQAVMMANGDTSEWLPEYEGKVIYFPVGVDFDGLSASGFIIKGSSDRGFLKCVFRSR